MKFGSVPLDRAEGAVLAHSVALSDGRLRKGTALGAAELARLAQGGIAEVVVARLAPEDVAEDAAAARLAQALVPDPDLVGLRIGPAATGRVNLFSQVTGVAEVDAARINAVNAVHPMITVATVPKWQRMAQGAMVATVKIISYAVPESDLVQACAVAAGGLQMRPTSIATAQLIHTAVGDDDCDKGQRAIQTRMERMGVALGDKMVVRHQIDALTVALRGVTADLVMILTGSATSDSRDVAPEAVRAAGGTVTHYGMPVDPGNLLFIGTLGGRPLIGLPGCARSPALNGADWVMERLICGVPVSSADLMGMGVGGLLKEIPSRPRPRNAGQ
ncbi:molybdopterin-binding protein [Puniceibacterium sp. IMCC21224]|uniref:molybdopterin-binding protein n=1 Tax=Puniceibacterium sp. IMCC21224 TaxID=1618204 RepID=UPI00064D84C2|nr:molybdopterin-binding protein [Puniceibacterium sp. IMCC21224]KMK66870.1 molybdopterin biosynthesis enzyme [Puniceibacterium sp. IMCC21224]